MHEGATDIPPTASPCLRAIFNSIFRNFDFADCISVFNVPYRSLPCVVRGWVDCLHQNSQRMRDLVYYSRVTNIDASNMSPESLLA